MAWVTLSECENGRPIPVKKPMSKKVKLHMVPARSKHRIHLTIFNVHTSDVTAKLFIGSKNDKFSIPLVIEPGLFKEITFVLGGEQILWAGVDTGEVRVIAEITLG